MSAKSADGLALISQVIGEILTSDLFEKTIELGPKDGQLRAFLYEQGAVLNERSDESGYMELEIRMQKRDFLQLLRQSLKMLK